MRPVINFCITFRQLLLLILILALLIFFVITYQLILNPNSHGSLTALPNASIKFSDEKFEDFDSWNRWDNVSGFPQLIVPNIVHFIKFEQHELTFTQFIVVLAAWCHQKPDRLIIHCDCSDLGGPYWPRVKNLRGIEVRRIERPAEVFGKPISKYFSVHHAGDVARIAVLRQYGGIALDLDTYVIRNLDEFRHFECTVGWPENENIGSQIIISHKKSRFLQLYSESYHAYNGSAWYYNAGQLPTRILELLPHIVHRVPWKLGVHSLLNQLFKSNWTEWRSYYAVHLLIRHRSDPPAEFDEYNIRNYSYTFGEMARQVLFGSTDLIPHNMKIPWDYGRCRE